MRDLSDTIFKTKIDTRQDTTTAISPTIIGTPVSLDKHIFISLLTLAHLDFVNTVSSFPNRSIMGFEQENCKGIFQAASQLLTITNRVPRHSQEFFQAESKLAGCGVRDPSFLRSSSQSSDILLSQQIVFSQLNEGGACEIFLSPQSIRSSRLNFTIYQLTWMLGTATVQIA